MSEARKKVIEHRAMLDQQWAGLVEAMRDIGPTALHMPNDLDKCSGRKFIEYAKCGPKMTTDGKRLIHHAATIAISEAVCRMMEQVTEDDE